MRTKILTFISIGHNHILSPRYLKLFHIGLRLKLKFDFFGPSGSSYFGYITTADHTKSRASSLNKCEIRKSAALTWGLSWFCSVPATKCWNIFDRAMTEAVRRHPVVSEAQDLSQASLGWIYGTQSATGIGSSSIPVFHRQYHFTNATYPHFIPLPPTLCNLSKRQSH